MSDQINPIEVAIFALRLMCKEIRLAEWQLMEVTNPALVKALREAVSDEAVDYLLRHGSLPPDKKS